MKVHGKTVLITGGCGGLGLAMAERFLALDKTVVLLDRNIARGAPIADKGDVRLVEIDFADAAGAEQCLRDLVETGLAPDILINNVGVSPKFDANGDRLKAWTIDLVGWNDIFAVNVTSHFLCTRVFLPHMIARGYGRVINIGSYAARTGGHQGTAHYQTTKSANLGFTRALAREAAPHGITVNAISPGRVMTHINADAPAAINEAFAKTVPLGRLGVPDDVAKAAVFFASDFADYITGASLDVNGGVFMPL